MEAVPSLVSEAERPSILAIREVLHVKDGFDKECDEALRVRRRAFAELYVLQRIADVTVVGT
jgi:hypothetical protein